MKYITTPLSVSVHGEKDNPIFGDTVVTVTVANEAAGPFIELRANTLIEGGIAMDLAQLLVVATVAKELVRAHEGLEK